MPTEESVSSPGNNDDAFCQLSVKRETHSL